MDNNNTPPSTTPNNNGNNPNPNPNPNSNSNSNPSSKQDQFLRHLTHLNKHSLKISKPHTQTQTQTQTHTAQPPVHQPPVYNISKSDFRDVVQRLTGSPSHSHASSPSPGPAQAAKPNSSRLQRIRPPPLAPLISGPRPGFSLDPMSPLPPLPTCHGAAESPISAYMRFLNSSYSPAIIFPPPENLDPVDNIENVVPSSPLSFGCLPSPKLALPLPPSPTVPSPK